MSKYITIKQKQARIKNWTKRRIKAAYTALCYAAGSEDVNLTDKCKSDLMNAAVLILIALKDWDKKNIKEV